MSFHDNLLGRRGGPKGRLTGSRTQREIEGELQRATAFDVASPVQHAPASFNGGGQSVQRPIGATAPTPDLPFTVRTLADRWGCSEGAVRNLIRDGKLGHFRIGDLIRIPAQEVGRFECRN